MPQRDDDTTRGCVEDLDKGNEEGVDPGQQAEVSADLAAAQAADQITEVSGCERGYPHLWTSFKTASGAAITLHRRPDRLVGDPVHLVRQGGCPVAYTCAGSLALRSAVCPTGPA